MEDTEEVATQQATQQVLDPRRLGQRGASDLSNDDLADVFCILQPITQPACYAAVDVYKATPQHAILTQESAPMRRHGEKRDQDDHMSDDDVLPCEIALRLSSKLKDPPSGFVFGRNKSRCDVVMGFDQLSKRISNVHFRIYINEYGVIMLEDQSTNGTAVDGVLLRGKDKENGTDWRHTLESGTVVTLAMPPPEIDYRFIVRIPARSEEHDEAYQRNLTAHFLRMRATNQTARKALNQDGKREPVNLFPTPEVTQYAANSMIGTRSIREWKGGQKYNKIGCIGKGAFAVVYKITAKFDGIPYAAKELEKRRFMKNGILDQKVETEMKIMKQIQHANVVRFIEHVDWEDKLYIIMEYIPGGDLGSLVNQQGCLQEQSVHSMATQLLSALKYLHGKGITHRDVKPDNILISTTNPFHVKLTDFGLSKMIDSEETFLRTFCGTLLYCAPEVYQEYREYDEYGQQHRTDKRLLPPQRYGHAVDIWSLAGVLFFALCGSPPYRVKNGVSYQELLNQIMTTPLDIRPLQQKGVSDRAIRFVRKMLHVRPENRATVEDLEKAPWMTGIDDGFDASTQESEGASIVDDFIDPYLQHAGSQLSIHDPHEQPHYGDDSEILGTQHEMRDDPGIPSSFSTEGKSEEEEDSLEYIPATAPNGHGPHGRLFGEVNPSMLVAQEQDPSQLPLPEPGRFVPINSQRQHAHDVLRESVEDNKENIAHVTPPFVAGLMPPPNRVTAVREQAHQVARPSSLHFAESMVDQLNMNSPGPEPVIQIQGPVVQGEGLDPAAATSLRRSRYEYENDDKTADWYPDELRLKRSRLSERAIKLELPVSVWWNPRDRTTHHSNYPRLSNFEWEALEELAESKGERFTPGGGKTFDQTMQSFHTTTASTSPSINNDLEMRAQSEPTIAQGRLRMMMRDERRLSANEERMELGQSQSSTNSTRSNGNIDLAPIVQTPLEPLVGDDFHPPKKILAKFMADPASCLPTLAFNITDPVTTWGRSPANSLRSINDKRIPEHAFKLVIFKPGFYDGSRDLNQIQWTPDEQDMKFYISSKATQTIYINNTQLLNHDSRHIDTESKYWAELRHNDVITVWWNQWVENEFTRFKFECLWGASREPGHEYEVKLVEQGALLDELEQVCLQEERRMSDDRARREQEEKHSKPQEEQGKMEREKIQFSEHGHGQANQQKRIFSTSAPALIKLQGGPANFTQSFSFRPEEG